MTESSRDTDLNCSCLRQSRRGNAIRSHARVDKAVSPLQSTAALIHLRKPCLHCKFTTSFGAYGSLSGSTDILPIRRDPRSIDVIIPHVDDISQNDNVHGNYRCLVYGYEGAALYECEKLTLILLTQRVTSSSSSQKCGKDYPLIVKMTRTIIPFPWTFINLDSVTQRVHDFFGHNCGSWVQLGHDLNGQESLHRGTETRRHAERLLLWYCVTLLGLHRDPDLPKNPYGIEHTATPVASLPVCHTAS